MKHLKRFNESRSEDLNYMIKKLTSGIDMADLRKLLEPYKNVLVKVAARYTNDGMIDSRLILNKVRVDEGIVDDIVTFLVRLVNLPINIVRIIIDFFKNRVDYFKFKKLAFASIVIVVLGLYVNDVIDVYNNGISYGIANEVEFIPEHVEVTTHTYTNADGEIETYTTEETIPDTWKVEVREFTGRVEKWTTIDRESGTSIDKDSVVHKKDNWQWEATIKRGNKKGGGFSGGGAGARY